MEKAMTEVKYYRKEHVITDLNGKVIFTGTYKVKAGEFVSINAAKRKSRQLQEQYGQGCLRVIS
jgi:hypothetical protein